MLRLTVKLAIVLTLPLSAAAEWRGTWHTSPQRAGNPPWEVGDVTFREYLRLSVGGGKLRLRFSNLYGSEGVKLGAVSVGIRDPKNPARCESLRTVHFSGKESAVLPPGGDLRSDAVDLAVADRATLCVSLYLPEKTKLRTVHGNSLHTDVLAKGARTLAPVAEGEPVQSRFLLTGVETEGRRVPVIGFLGDSITDGANATMDANHRWPDILGERLAAAGAPAAILNAGIGGNRLLRDSPEKDAPFGIGENALARFERELLHEPVTHAFVLIGINDIGHPGHRAPLEEKVTAADLIAGYRKLAAAAKAKGVKIYVGTLGPFEGVPYSGYYSGEKEKVRQEVNDWLRSSKDFTAVVDFDRALRDPSHPLRLLPAYDSGDHIHPSDAGYRAMAQAVDLSLLGVPASAAAFTSAADAAGPATSAE